MIVKVYINKCNINEYLEKLSKQETKMERKGHRNKQYLNVLVTNPLFSNSTNNKFIFIEKKRKKQRQNKNNLMLIIFDCPTTLFQISYSRLKYIV